jgi:hypothetical protein
MSVEEQVRESLRTSVEGLGPWALAPSAVVAAGRVARRRRVATAASAVTVALLLVAVGAAAGTPRPRPQPAAPPAPGLELRRGYTLLEPGGPVQIPFEMGESIRDVAHVDGGWVVTTTSSSSTYVRFLSERGERRDIATLPGTAPVAIDRSRVAVVVDGAVNLYQAGPAALARTIDLDLPAGAAIVALFLTSDRVIVQTFSGSYGPAGSGWVVYVVPVSGGPIVTVAGRVLDVNRYGGRAAMVTWTTEAEGGLPCLGVVGVDELARGQRPSAGTCDASYAFAIAWLSPDGKSVAVAHGDGRLGLGVEVDGGSPFPGLAFIPVEWGLYWADATTLLVLDADGRPVQRCARACEPYAVDPPDVSVVRDLR